MRRLRSLAAAALCAAGARAESTVPPAPAAELRNAEENVGYATLSRAGRLSIQLYDGRSAACPAVKGSAVVKALDLSLRLAPVTPSRIQERRPCAEDEWRWEPTLRVYRSPDDDGAKPMLFEPACGWGWAPSDAAHAQAARSLAGLLAQEAADCLRRAFDPLELLAAQGRSAHHRDTGWRKLAAGAPRVAAEEFRACLKEAVQGRVIEECARGLEEADGRVKAGAPEAAPRALEYAVAFRPGSAEPTPEGLALLSRLADTLRYYPLDGVRLSAAAPEPLARRRLEAARKALTEAGVKAANIETAVEASAGKADSLRVAITEGR